MPIHKVQDGDVSTIRCAHGDTVLYPLAKVTLEVGGRRMEVEAAISDTLPMSALLGTDVPELGDLIGRDIPPTQPTKDEAFVVTTRTQAKKREEEEAVQHQKELESGVQPNPLPAEEEEEGDGSKPRIFPRQSPFQSQRNVNR